MKTIRICCGLVAAFWVTGCTSMDVQTEASSTYDFTRLGTYSWMSNPHADKESDPRLDHPFIDENIRKYVDRTLRDKGFRTGSHDRADFQVGYTVLLEDMVDRDVVDRTYEDRPSSGWAFSRDEGWAFGTQEPDVEFRQYERGTLTLNVLDTAGKKLIWRGTAKAEIDRSLPEAEKKKKVEKAVSSLLARFPNQGSPMHIHPVGR